MDGERPSDGGRRMTLREKLFSFLYGNGIVSLLRIITGAVFIVSGSMKIADPSAFADSIALYGVIPQILIPYIAIVLPWAELFSGILLASGLRIRAASLLSFTMLCLFTALIGWNVALGRSFECGCIPGLDAGPFSRIGWPLLCRNAVLLALTALFFQAKRHPFSIDSFIEKRGLRK